jgi:hypothetical protein
MLGFDGVVTRLTRSSLLNLSADRLTLFRRYVKIASPSIFLPKDEKPFETGPSEDEGIYTLFEPLKRSTFR